MKDFFISSKEWGFWVAAIILFFVLAGFTIYTVSFLGEMLNTTLTQSPDGASLIEHFDFDTLNQVLISKQIAPISSITQ